MVLLCEFCRSTRLQIRSQVVPVDKDPCNSARYSASEFLSRNKGLISYTSTRHQERNALVITDAPFLLLRVIPIELFNRTLSLVNSVVPAGFRLLFASGDFSLLLFAPVSVDADTSVTRDRRWAVNCVLDDLGLVFDGLIENWSGGECRRLRLRCECCCVGGLLRGRILRLICVSGYVG